MDHRDKFSEPSLLTRLFIKRLFRDDGGMRLGDFTEIFNDYIETEGWFLGRLLFYNYILLSIPHFIRSSILRSYAMFRNYVKITLRNFSRQKAYSLINISGLAIGITCFIFIMIYVKFEDSYDGFHERSDRIFRINQHWEAWNFRGSSDFASTNGAMYNVLTDEFHEIEMALRLQGVSSALRYEENSVVVNGIYADKEFFNIFTFPLVKGDPNNTLKDSHTMVLTKDLAVRLFGDEDPIGKVVHGLRGLAITVTGVCENVPENSHLYFDFVLSFRTMYSLRSDLDTSWGILNYYNYILLKEGIRYKEFESKLVRLVEKYHGPERTVRRYFLQPVTDIHLDSGINSWYGNVSDRKYIYLFTTVAFLILIIAGVNYINLATSRASLRGREVGIRKTVGALRNELMKQFLGESVFLTFTAFILSLTAVYTIYPYFRDFVGINIPLDVLTNPLSLAGLTGLIFLLGIISGSYPSLLLSSLRPVNVLKAGSKNISPGKRLNLRNVLVVFQFFVSVILIVATIVIYKQLSYIENKDLGYDRNNIITVSIWDSNSRDKYDVIKEELINHRNIYSASFSDRAPLRASENSTIRVIDENGKTMRLPQTSHFYVDNDYVESYGMEIITGRNFSKEFSTDIDKSVIVNETVVNSLGLENPVGMRISTSNSSDAIIIGVVKDFHFSTFDFKITPAVFVPVERWGRILSVKIAGNDIPGTVEYIESTVKTHISDFVFNYQFLDDQFLNLYSSQKRMGSLFTLFSVIALSIASIGLLGLISFIASQKTREIGIRKVLGASTSRITGLVVKEFIILVFVSSFLALPVSYFIMNNWLNEFVYKTDITIWNMMLSALIVFIIAALSVIYQVLKAAKANPVDSLNFE